MYVNKGFFGRIDGVSRDESDIIAKYCFDLINNNMDIQCRFKWEKGSVALWDNRCTWHSGKPFSSDLPTRKGFLLTTIQLSSTTTRSARERGHRPLARSLTSTLRRNTSLRL